MKYILILLVFILIMVSSCSVKKNIVNTEKSDSVRVEYVETIIIKDSLVEVKIPADKAIIKALLECDSLGIVHIKNIEKLETGSHLKPKIIIKDNYIISECEVDSFLVYALWKDRQDVRHSSYEQKTNKSVDTLIKKRSLPWWAYLASVGIFVLGLVIGVLLKKLHII